MTIAEQLRHANGFLAELWEEYNGARDIGISTERVKARIQLQAERVKRLEAQRDAEKEKEKVCCS